MVSGIVSWISGILMLRVAWKLKNLADTKAKDAEETLAKARDEAKKLMENAELEIKWRSNQISMLGPDELYLYVAHRFNMCLEIAARTDVSKGEWHIETRLYEKAYIRLAIDNEETGVIAALGPDTIEAINARYGQTYLQRICDQYFRWLIAKGAIPRLIDRDIGVAELDRMVDNGVTRKDK